MENQHVFFSASFFPSSNSKIYQDFLWTIQFFLLLSNRRKHLIGIISQIWFNFCRFWRLNDIHSNYVLKHSIPIHIDEMNELIFYKLPKIEKKDYNASHSIYLSFPCHSIPSTLPRTIHYYLVKPNFFEPKITLTKMPKTKELSKVKTPEDIFIISDEIKDVKKIRPQLMRFIWQLHNGCDGIACQTLKNM